MSRLLKGKYINELFEDVLAKDLPYCEFIIGLKFVTKEFEEFKKFLVVNIENRRKLDLSEKISKLT